MSEEVRDVWARARAEAQARREQFGSVHLLTALVDGGGALGRLLGAHGVTSRWLRMKSRDAGPEPSATTRQIEAASERIARSVRARQTSSAHLLAALLRSPESAAFRVLHCRDIDPGALETATIAHYSGSTRFRRRTKDDEVDDPGPALAAGPLASPLAPRLSCRSPRPVGSSSGRATDRSTIPARALREPARTQAAAAPERAPAAAPAPVAAAPTPLPTPEPQRNRPERRRAPAAWAPVDPRRAPWLAAHGRDLTEAAAEGRLDPAVAREDVVDRVLDVLSKRRGSSVCLVGPPGVGKTSAVHALAHRLATSGDAGIRLFDVAFDALLSGGSAGDRIRAVAGEARRLGDRVVLAVGDAAQFVRAAAESGEGAEAALRKALEGRSFAVIGEAAPDSWDRTARQFPGAARWFTTIEVAEPDAPAAERMLRAVAPRYGDHHGVGIDDGGIEAAARIARRYLSGRALPDRAVQLIDLAAARTRREGRDRAGAADVAAVASDLIDVPAERLTATDAARFLALEDELAERIVGHRHAIATIADVLRRNAAGFRTRRPIGSFLFLGPTGVGKTETAKAIAESLYPGRENLLRLDMSEYAEPHAVARLVGAPPGYVGYESGGLIAEALRRRPYQVTLLDEFEKAHPDVHRIFLQVLEEGCLTDGRGSRIDFSNAVVVMTSNLGSDLFASRRPVGFGRDDPSDAADEAVRAARRALPPELWNRIDETVVFLPLGRSEVERIARMMLDASLAAAGAGRDVSIVYDDAVPAALLDAGGYDPAFGARPMRRTIQRLIEAPLARVLLRGDHTPGGVLRLRRDGSEIAIERLDGARDREDARAS